MMDLPPPPVQPCIVLETAQLGSAFSSDYPMWNLDPEEPQQDAQVIQLRAPTDTPYHQIDSVLDAAQRLGLTVTMKTEPPICGMEKL